MVFLLKLPWHKISESIFPSIFPAGFHDGKFPEDGAQ